MRLHKSVKTGLTVTQRMQGNWPPQEGELELGAVLASYELIIYPYTYQGTARILLRQMREVLNNVCGECDTSFNERSPYCPHRVWDKHPR